MGDGEISVDLRLSLGKLAEDVARAQKVISEGMKSAMAGIGIGGDASGGEGAQQPRRQLWSPADEAQRRAELAAERAAAKLQAAAIGGGDAGGGSGASGGGGTGSPQQPAPAFRSLWQQVTLGIGAFRMLQIAIHQVQRVINELAEAFKRAAAMYARVSQAGGAAPAWEVQKQVTGGVMGVSPNEMVKFGEAFAVLTEKTRVAVATLTDTMNTLTAATWNWRAMMVSIQAMFAKFGESIAPIVNQLTGMVQAFAEFQIAIAEANPVLLVFKSIMNIVTPTMAALALAAMAGSLGIQALVDALKALWQQVNNMLADMHTPGFKRDNSAPFQNTKDAAEAMAKFAAAAFGSGKESAPNPSQNVARMPGSAWERMGLVVGASGGVNYAKDTATNTKQTVELLKRVASGLPRGGGIPRQIPNQP